MTTITLNPKLIKALIPFAAVTDPREYLNGICPGLFAHRPSIPR